MRRFRTIWSMVFAMATLLAGLCTMPLVYAAKRGQCPECQEECLEKHAEKLRGLADRYKKTGDRPGYQYDVDGAVNEYKTCLENCREPYPVK